MEPTKVCQNCNKSFTLEEEDFELLEKIKVPPPTFCPTCSHQRRFAWRNTHSLYHRTDSITGEDIISIYHKDTKMNIVSQEYWWSDAWDPMDYGIEYDFNKNFFSQWKELRDKIPFQALSNSKAVNSPFCNVAEESYDCYLISASWKNERTMYSDSIKEIKDSLDLYVGIKNEFCYENIYCNDSYKLKYSEKSNNCIESFFLYDCKNSTNCFMSSNLRNKSYVFENRQLNKDEYFREIEKIDLLKYSIIEKLKISFKELKINSIHRYATIVNSRDSSGDNILNSKSCKNCFDFFQNPENCMHCFWGGVQAKDMYYCGPGMGLGEIFYESFDGAVNGSRNICTSVVYNSSNVDYSFNCYNCQNIFGCIGLRNKSYCILNKQYSKEVYFSLVSKIKEHMNSMPYVDKASRTYRYGEFFPVELSPFAYNETIANMFYPLTKEQALSTGYLWRDPEEKKYVPTISIENIPDSIDEVKDNILEDIIPCAHLDPTFSRCTSAFRITPQELSFYRRLKIPLPRLCYQCRHYERFKKRNPLELWERTCMNTFSPIYNGQCKNTFKTSYSPDRPEIIYCEECYKNKVL